MNKLINKLMSRNYHEYQMSENAKAIYTPVDQSVALRESEKIEMDPETLQELNTLNGIA